MSEVDVKDSIAANRRHWDEVVAIHARSAL